MLNQATLELFGREPIQRILTRVKGELAKQWDHSIRHATPHHENNIGTGTDIHAE
jgi:hypothetical protein